MPRKSVTSRKKATKKAAGKAAQAPKKPRRVSRDRVMTFRISEEEAALIAKAADRIPLARFSRDAVLAKAAADAK